MLKIFSIQKSEEIVPSTFLIGSNPIELNTFLLVYF